jgi:hypothetical protein
MLINLQGFTIFLMTDKYVFLGGESTSWLPALQLHPEVIDFVGELKASGYKVVLITPDNEVPSSDLDDLVDLQFANKSWQPNGHGDLTLLANDLPAGALENGVMVAHGDYAQATPEGMPVVIAPYIAGNLWNSPKVNLAVRTLLREGGTPQEWFDRFMGGEKKKEVSLGNHSYTFEVKKTDPIPDPEYTRRIVTPT